METLRQIIETKPPFQMNVRSFFIGWCGVPMLTYTGFPSCVLSLKEQILQSFPHLLPENPGSKWPCTTLGALQDHKVLSLAELNKLHEICETYNNKIETNPYSFLVTQLMYVLFNTRNLEKKLLSVPLALNQNLPSDNTFTKKHLHWINHIHNQFSRVRLAEYLPAVQQDGHRISHYRALKVESTLVIELPTPQPFYIESFIEAIDSAFPNYFEWFSPQSRHITIRALAFA